MDATTSSSTERNGIADILNWRFKPVQFDSVRSSACSLSSTSSSCSSSSSPSEKQEKEWTTHDQVTWFRMCTALQRIASSSSPTDQFDLLTPSEINDETYWIERCCQGQDDDDKSSDGSSETSSFLCIVDKNGFYKLRIPLLMDPEIPKAICLLTLKEVSKHDNRGIQDLEGSSTEFLSFLRLFSVIAGQLFPKVFAVSYCYKHYCDVIAYEHHKKSIVDEKLIDCVPTEGGIRKEFLEHFQAMQLRVGTTCVAPLADLCTVKLMTLSLDMEGKRSGGRGGGGGGGKKRRCNDISG